MEHVNRRDALIGLPVASTVVSAGGAAAQTEGREIAPGVRRIDDTKRETLIPNYKTVLHAGHRVSTGLKHQRVEYAQRHGLPYGRRRTDGRYGLRREPIQEGRRVVVRQGDAGAKQEHRQHRCHHADNRSAASIARGLAISIEIERVAVRLRCCAARTPCSLRSNCSSTEEHPMSEGL